MERWEIVVVGAGAAGLMAACAAAKEQKAQGRPVNLLVLEGNPKPGRKLLATGNGRCNLTNLDAGPAHYHGDAALAAPLLEAWPPARVLGAFEEMGLLCRADGEGRVYPRNLQAAAVLQALVESCAQLGVSLRCGKGVSAIHREGEGFLLELAGGESLAAGRCILACGGKASPKHSWEGGGYDLARQLGHTVTPLRPSLTTLQSPKKSLRSLKGMRVKARASLLAHGRPVYQESGEVLFGAGGLSGICVFNLSAHLGGQPLEGGEVSLDLFQEMSYQDVLAYLEAQVKAHPRRQGWELFAGALNLRVGEELMKELSLPREAMFADLTRQQLRKAASLSKDWRFPIAGTGDWASAQVTAGGVPLREVDCGTLESKKAPGLYLAGELLNLDGDCGGYNLHWAWATGLAAGQSAGSRRKAHHGKN